jgi:uncharacterized protein YjiS (DUF1127 family)
MSHWTLHRLLLRLSRPSGLPVGLWLSRRRGRRALARLDAALLRDIGRSRAEAGVEARKPFWRA